MHEWREISCNKTDTQNQLNRKVHPTIATTTSHVCLTRCVCNWLNPLSIRKSTGSTLNLRPISDCNFSNTQFSISHLSTVVGDPSSFCLIHFLFSKSSRCCLHSIYSRFSFISSWNDFNDFIFRYSANFSQINTVQIGIQAFFARLLIDFFPIFSIISYWICREEKTHKIFCWNFNR